MFHYVDGLRCDNLEQAHVLASRLFKRFEGYRTVQIKDANGVVVHELEATEDTDGIDLDTIDWIGRN